MVHIARQPILKTDGHTFGYELLYRDGMSGKNRADVLDGDQATRTVISDSLTVFGLDKLTNHSVAFINFTRELLMGDDLSLMSPQNLMVEILEDIVIDAPFVKCVEEWTKQGYHFAVDDYAGQTDISALLPYVDIIKVDFLQLSCAQTAAIAKALKSARKQLLAEKIETAEAYAHAKQAGYTLFQGYYFERPELLHANLPNAQRMTCLRVFNEARRPELNFDAMAEIVRTDMALSYKLLRYVSTPQFYRGNVVEDVKTALVRLGAENVRKWMLLTFMKEMGGEESSELVKSALVRAVFCEKLAVSLHLPAQRSNAYYSGLFSMLELTLTDSEDELMTLVSIPAPVKAALVEKVGALYDIVCFATAYQNGDWEQVLGFVCAHKLNEERIAHQYCEALQTADETFDADAAGLS